jgi:hypothetical protein
MILDPIKNRSKDAPIKAPALNVTLFSGAVLSLGTIVTYWTDFFDQLFGYSPKENPGPAAAIFAALVLAMGFIVAADLIARGVASSRTSDTTAMPHGWTAALVQTGADLEDCAVAAVRVTSAGPEYFIVNGEERSWRTPGTTAGQIKLSGPS